MKCKNCGTDAYDYQTICLNCGNRLVEDKLIVEKEVTEKAEMVKQINDDKKLIVLLIAITFGGIGAHCFYLGEKKKGICRLLMGLFVYPVSVIFCILDIIKIATGKYICDAG